MQILHNLHQVSLLLKIIYHHDNYWILYIEGQEANRWYHRRGVLETEIKLFGELPNNKRVIVTVHFGTYDEKITFEVLEKGKKI